MTKRIEELETQIGKDSDDEPWAMSHENVSLMINFNLYS